MSNQRTMVLPAEVVLRVDEIRGDTSRAEFINLLLDSHLGKTSDMEQQKFVTSEALVDFEDGIKELLRTFLEFFITYGLEVGKGSGNSDLGSLAEILREGPDSSASAQT